MRGVAGTGGDGRARGALAYEPGIDGLRALAIIAVLLFHGGFEWASGGFLGVSLFFTLSGFLITRILLTEHDTTGRIDLWAFWGRRLRRLAPAALTGLLLVIALTPWIVDAGQHAAARWDVWSALTHWTNWRLATSGTSYADLFATPSPVQHYWSLAIEEQFYFAYPLVAVVVLRRWGRSALTPTLAFLLAASLGASFLTSSSDLVYYGTHTRAAELLIGALAGIFVHREVHRATRRSGLVAGSGVVALLVIAWLVTSIDVTTEQLYEGGFAAIAVLSATVVVASTAPGPLRSALGASPVVAIGKISYGLYLFHWPVFQWLTPERVGLDGVRLFAVRTAAAALVAVASYHVVELPIRERRRLVEPGHARRALAAALIVVAVAAGPLAMSRDDGTITIVAGGVADFGRDDGPESARSVLGERPTLQIGVLTADAGVVAELRAITGVRVTSHRPRCAVLDCDVTGADALAPREVDVAVIALSAADRATLVGVEGDARILRFIELSDELTRVVEHYTDAGVPVVMVETAEPDYLTVRLDMADLGSDLATFVPRPELAGAIRARLHANVERTRSRADTRLDVMVIGDSTSYGAAAALDAAASDRMHVLWAGEPNCPLVEVDRLRWWKGNEFSGHDCPTLERWTAVAEGFRPDVLVVMSGLTEQTELRMPGSDEWVVAGDDPFVAAHDALMAALLDLVEPYGAVVVVADAPQFSSGPLSRTPMAGEERIAAWNAQIAGWGERWSRVHTLGWAALLDELESNGTVRPDGVHLDHDTHAAVGERLAPELLRIVSARGSSTETRASLR